MSDGSYLFYTVGLGNDNDVSNIIERCIDDNHCDGVVFEVDKERQLFDDLMFLKDHVVELLSSNKQVGFRGIPECVIKIILDSYWYMRFCETKIAEENICHYQNNILSFSQCKNCLDRDTCSGTGNKNRDFLKKGSKEANQKQK